MWAVRFRLEGHTWDVNRLSSYFKLWHTLLWRALFRVSFLEERREAVAQNKTMKVNKLEVKGETDRCWNPLLRDTWRYLFHVMLQTTAHTRFCQHILIAHQRSETLQFSALYAHKSRRNNPENTTKNSGQRSEAGGQRQAVGLATSAPVNSAGHERKHWSMFKFIMFLIYHIVSLLQSAWV